MNFFVSVSISVRSCLSVIKLASRHSLSTYDEDLKMFYLCFRRHFLKIGSLAKQRILKISTTSTFHRGQALGTILAMVIINHCTRKKKRKRKFP
jgi:hypothetical protein